MVEESRQIAYLETNFFLHHHTIDSEKRRSRFSVHCHNEYEIYFFLRGSGRFLIEGKQHILEPYTLILIRPKQLHCYQIDSLSEYERYVIIFEPQSIDGAFREHLLEPFAEKENGDACFYDNLKESSLRQLFDRFSECQLYDEDLKKVMISSLLQELLVAIHSISDTCQKKETPKPVSRTVREILDFINSHIAEELTLQNVAQRFFLSESHFSRIFHRQMGVGFKEYILTKRVLMAQKALGEGISAMEACRISGFNDYSSFFRKYRQLMGNCPSADKP
jgi:AraC-like DNA-binding protein